MRQLFIVITLITSFSLNAEPLYWRAEKGALNYLILGSVHVGDASMFPLPETITKTLQSSSGLIVETDIRKSHGVTYPETKVLSRNVLSSSQQSQLNQIATQLQVNPQDLLNAPPWAAALAIQMKQIERLGYRADNGVDLRLVYKATLSNVPVFSLEPLQFQINLLTGQKDGGKELLESAIEEFDEAEQATHCLIDTWKAGDLVKLNEFAQKTEMSPEFEDAFIFKRNQNWASKLAEPSWLPEPHGTYLMVVGSLHLVGEQNVLSLLKDKGFKITQVSKSGSVSCSFD